MSKVKKYYYHHPGMSYAVNFWGKNEKEIREQVLNWLGRKRLPNGYCIWEAGNDEALANNINDMAAAYHEAGMPLDI